MRALSIPTLLILVTTGQAHFHMLLPDKPSAKKGAEVTVTCQFGHPFEGELSDMLAPHRVVLYGPDGAETDVMKKVEKVALKGVKGNVDGYRLKFTPQQRGDYVIEMTSAPTPLPDTKETIQDTVKVVVHVQAQKGWDRRTTLDFGCRPLTRPYGLLPNAVFQVEYGVTHARRARGDKKVDREPRPVSDILVEVERYNSTPPTAIPPDEFITRTVKTDVNGVATTNLPEAGWWCLTATRRGTDKVAVGGKETEVQRRATLWVHVHTPPPINFVE